MKSGGSSKKFPANAAQWEPVMTRALGKDRPLTVNEEAKWSNAVVVNGGGYQAASAAVAAKRKPSQRGHQRFSHSRIGTKA